VPVKSERTPGPGSLEAFCGSVAEANGLFPINVPKLRPRTGFTCSSLLKEKDCDNNFFTLLIFDYWHSTCYSNSYSGWQKAISEHSEIIKPAFCFVHAVEKKEVRMQIKTNRKAGFTLVEIMIVVAIIGLLAAIAIPNFVKARTQSQTSACINNLRLIDSAIQQWALEKAVATTGAVTTDGIQPYLGRGAAGTLPYCPADSAKAWASSYTVNTVADKPTCLIGGTGHGDGTHILQ